MTGCFRRRGAGARRRRCKIFGPLRRRRRIEAASVGVRVAQGAWSGALVFLSRGWAMFAFFAGDLSVVGFGCCWPGRVCDGMAFPPGLGGSRWPPRLWRFSCSPLLRVDAQWTVSVVRRGRRSLRWGRCRTTPEALHSWLWALVLGSRVVGGVSPLWRATAACERHRRTCLGELVRLSGADSGACQSRLGSVIHWRKLSAS